MTTDFSLLCRSKVVSPPTAVFRKAPVGFQGRRCLSASITVSVTCTAQRWSDDETVPVVVLLELLWGHHEDIHGLSGAIQAHVNITNDLAQIVVSALDDQDIDVTMGAHLPASRRTKKDDALRLGHVH